MELCKKKRGRPSKKDIKKMKITIISLLAISVICFSLLIIFFSVRAANFLYFEKLRLLAKHLQIVSRPTPSFGIYRE